MIRVSVLYPHQDGARFDWSYYLSKHVPMVVARFGAAAKSTSIEHGLAGEAPGSPPRYVAIAQFGFDSMASFQAAFAPHAAEILADIPKYTSIEPILQFSEVKFSV